MKFLSQNKAKFCCDNKQPPKSVFVLTEVALSTDSRKAGIHNIYNTCTYRGVKTGSQIHVLIDSDMDKNETCLFYIQVFI